MAQLKGFVTHIIYRNNGNGYTVFELNTGDEITCVGTFQSLEEGEILELEGDFTEHAVYGSQFKVSSFKFSSPEDAAGMERYLGSGAIKGVGASLAARIVKRFGADTFRIIEEEPERLAEIKGISERKAMDIASQMEEKHEMREAMVYLQKYGISNTLAVRIYETYGSRLYRVLEENPYQLADDIDGIGFRKADELAARIGIHTDSDFRIRSGILYTLLQASGEGHMYLPGSVLIRRAAALLDLPQEAIADQLPNLSMDKKMVIKKNGEDTICYAFSYYYAELACARMLVELNQTMLPEGELLPAQEEAILKRVDQIQQQEGLMLDELQRKAVLESVRNSILILTGGPGTGKTTTINTIIRYFEGEGLDLYLAAPTGRAAKRMTEATGYEARTIHRMLELSGAMPESGKKASFERNEDNPLEADVIIVDEMSMVDIHLFQSLLKAVSPGTRLILVGDVNQLPSVGPGQVLADLIASEVFPVVCLQKIFRQAQESDIVVNAHRINKGEQIALTNKSRDFFFLKRYDADIIIRVVIALIQEKLPRYVDAKPFEIQVLTPMRKGLLGVERLNQILQRYLNPPEDGKSERAVGDRLFRTGDKVMQIRNNYQMEWEIRGRYGVVIEKGVGVFNGDTGILREINEFAETAEVEFEDGRFAMYSFKQLEELELAYAITIHKSQGSEYPAVILPLLSGPQMLLNRNLLYTAVTRARKCVTVVGNEETFAEMIRNEKQQKRYSALDERIRELSETTGDNNTDGEE